MIKNAAKRALLLMTASAVLAGCFPAAAQETENPELLNVKFDNYITNRGIDDTIVSEGEPRIVQDGEKNKAYHFPGGYGKFTRSIGTMPDKFTVSLDVKANSSDAAFSLRFGNNENAGGTTLITVKDCNIITPENKIVGGVGNAYTTISAVVDNRNMIYDLYINGNRVLHAWKLSEKLGGFMTYENHAGSVNIDNVCVREGTAPSISGASVTYQPIADAHIDYDYFTNSDVALVDTETGIDDRAYTKKDYKYQMGWKAEKTNKITLNRIVNREKSDRDNAYIIIEKTTGDDAYYDFNNLDSSQRSNDDDGDYGHFAGLLYTGRLRIDKMGSEVTFCFFRDTKTTGSNVSFHPVKIDASGKVITDSGMTAKQLSEGEWLNFKLWIDFENMRSDFYIDEQFVESFTLSKNFRRPEMLRIAISANGDACTVTYDKLKVLGMRNTYNHNQPDYHPAQWTDDRGIEQFLDGKVAFYGYSENIFSGGEKHVRVEKPYVGEDGTVYVGAKALSVGYGLTLATKCSVRTVTGSGLTMTADSNKVIYNDKEIEMDKPCIWKDKKLYVPIASFAEKVLGHTVKTDTRGLVITAEKPFDLYTGDTVDDFHFSGVHRFIQNANYRTGMTPVRVLNYYMSFERPSAKTLQEDFNAATNNGEMHPRIIAKKEDFDRVRALKDTDEYMKKCVEQIMGSADELLSDTEKPYALPNGTDLLTAARHYLDRNSNLGFAWQMTHDEKYAKKLWEGLQYVLNYPDWNFTHMIDSGELAMGVAIGYDWIYDYLTEEQRAFVQERLIKQMIDPQIDIIRDLCATRHVMANAGDYATSKSNFNAVINSGIIAACLSIAESNPEKCFRLLELSVRSVENGIMLIRPDGTWQESPGYWNYAFSYLCRGLQSLMNSTGNHYGFMDAQGMENTGKWYMQNESSNGNYAYHDGDAGPADSRFPAMLARYYGDEDLQALCYMQLKRDRRTTRVEDPLFYDPSCKGNADNLELDAFYKGLDLVYSRSSYTDNNAMYFAAHAGQVKTYHSQADVGTFVFDLDGVRWAQELGKEDYASIRDSSVPPYRSTMQGHNVMVHDIETNWWGLDYGYDVMCYTDKYESKEAGSMIIYDMHEPYKQFVKDHHRGFYVGDNRRSLTVQDRFTPLKDMDSYWFMQTKADVEIQDNRTVILSQAGKKLKMEIRTDAPDYVVEKGPATQLGKAAAGQNANVGYTRIRIKLPVHSDTTYTVTVKLSALDEATSSIDAMTIPMEEWVIPDDSYQVKPSLNASNIRVNGKKLSEVVVDGKIPFVEGQEVPKITADPENPANSVEIIYDDSGEFGSVRVWNPDKSAYSDTNIGFKVTKSANLDAFNILDIADYSVSSTLEEWNPKESMLDNNFLTRWTSAAVSGEYALFDLGETKQVDAVALAFWQGDTRCYQYEIQGSVDGNQWVSLKKGGSSVETEGFELMEFNGAPYRFIKVIGYGNTVNKLTNILEFRALQRK